MLSMAIIRNRISNSARALATALPCRMNRVGQPSGRRRLVMQVNWGNTDGALLRADSPVLNQAANIDLATSKLAAFTTMQQAGVRVPFFWPARDQVVRGTTHIILARTMLRASGGRGITVLRPGEELPAAPLYVKYVRKEVEYRVHVAGGEALVVQQKRRRNGADQTDNQALIRNYDYGWVFAVENVTFVSRGIEDDVKAQAVNAVRALGLDFGAVDIVVASRGNEAYVLEVNTAPGIESPTVLAAYVEYFRRKYNGYREGN